MFSLYRTLPFTQVHYVSMLIPQDLEFNMSGLPDKALQKHIRIVKSLCSFIGGQGEHSFNVFLFLHHAHTAATSSGCSFQDHRITNLICNFSGLFGIPNCSRTSTQKGNAVFPGQLFGNGFMPHAIDGIV